MGGRDGASRGMRQACGRGCWFHGEQQGGAGGWEQILGCENQRQHPPLQTPGTLPRNIGTARFGGWFGSCLEGSSDADALWQASGMRGGAR